MTRWVGNLDGVGTRWEMWSKDRRKLNPLDTMFMGL